LILLGGGSISRDGGGGGRDSFTNGDALLPATEKLMAGRPTKFKEEYIHQARVAFGEGFTDAKFATLIGIGKRTFHEWRQNNEDFDKAVQEGKDEFDTNKMEASLKKRGLGFRYTETTREPDENGKLQIVKTVSKLVIPDTTAMIFWLKNRRSDRWRDVKAVEASGPDGGAMPIELTVNFVDSNGN
jgi:hypothetical protein